MTSKPAKPGPVGGVVIEVSNVKAQEGQIYIRYAYRNGWERMYGSVLVYRDAKSEQVEFGDSLWWLGSKVMWTPFAHSEKLRQKKQGSAKPRAGKDFDIKLERIGLANGPHPDNVYLDVVYKLPKIK